MVDQKIDLEMIDICAQTMNQDVANILEWDNLDEHEQEQRALALYEVYKGDSLNELKKKFDYWTLVCIQKRIVNCFTGTERVLIDIIELVAQRGVLTNIKYPFHQTDLLFQDDHRSELFEKIRFLTIGKFYEVDELQGSNCDSNIIKQLIGIYLVLMVNKKIDSVMISISTKVQIQECIEIINKLNNSSLQTIEEQNVLINYDILEKDLLRTASSLRAGLSIIEGKYKILYKRKIIEDIQKLIKERVPSILHINCPSEISCQLSINIRTSLGINYIQQSALQAINDIARDDNNFQDYLLNDHNIFLHIIYIINNLASNYSSSVDMIKKDNESTTFNSSFFLALPALQHLSFILSRINQQIIKNLENTSPTTVRNISCFINSLIQLTRFGRAQNEDYDVQSPSQVRKVCIQCLNQIQIKKRSSEELYKGNCLSAMNDAIATCGGSEEEDKDTINSALTYFERIFFRDYRNQFSLQRLILSKMLQEQFEECGCSEEIESLLLQNKRYYSEVKQTAKRVKFYYSNLFCNHSNSMWWQS